MRRGAPPPLRRSPRQLSPDGQSNHLRNTHGGGFRGPPSQPIGVLDPNEFVLLLSVFEGREPLLHPCDMNLEVGPMRDTLN
jgi:hypothetical protein